MKFDSDKYLSKSAWKNRKQKSKIFKEERNFFVHESSYVDDDVVIGYGTKIWHFCHVMPKTTIGENCSFGQNCVIGPNVKVGNGVKVQNNISIYEGVEIEDDVFLGPSMVFTNVYNPRAFIRRDRATEFLKTKICKGVSIGANATIVCGNKIGEYSLVGAGAVINRDVKAFALMVGVPARQIGWVSKAGNRLEFDENGFSEDAFDGTRYQLVNDVLKEVKNEN